MRGKSVAVTPLSSDASNTTTMLDALDQERQVQVDKIVSESTELQAKYGKTRIVLRAVYGKKQGALFLSPRRDSSTGELLGVSMLSQREKEKAIKLIDENTVRKITDDSIIDFSKPVDVIDWRWMQHCDEIVSSFDEAVSSPKAMFYVEDIDDEIERRVRREEKYFEAMQFVKESSEAKRVEIARLTGQRVESLRSNEILDYLYSVAKGTPEKILSIKEDKNNKIKLFLFKLLDKNIITNNNSTYKYGEVVLGLNEDQVFYWLRDAANADIVGRLKQLVEE